MQARTLDGNGRPASPWQRLGLESGLRLDVDGCRTYRLRAGGCMACVASCPRQALSLSAGGLTVNHDCVACGRCVPACPMGALEQPGFVSGATARSQDAPVLTVECRRVPASERAPDALVVPCLGGLDAAWLIERQRTQGGVRLQDRGLCRTCPAGGADAHPASRALGHARDLLEGMGIPLGRLPVLEQAAPVTLPAGKQEVPPDMGPDLSRRAFFGRLARHADEAVFPRQGEDTHDKVLVPGRRSSRTRWRLLAACVGLARDYGLPVPHGLFVQASITRDCCGHGLCVAVCPTGALQTQKIDGGEARVFNALECIACGACMDSCPEQAFRLDACHDESWRRPRELTRIVRKVCVDCGCEFTDADGKLHCAACRKSWGLVKDVYEQLFPRNA